MPLYHIRYMNSTGEVQEGTERADSPAEIAQRLREKEQYPIDVKRVMSFTSLNIHLFSRIKMKDIAVFCRQFHTMLASGVTIVNCLEILRQEEEKNRFRKVIDGLYEDVQKGNTFSEALEKYTDVFPPLMIYMVAAGETAGSLDTVMSRLAIHYEKEYKITNKIISAFVYPIILTVIAIAAILFMLTVVLPTFLAMFEESGVPLPAPTLIVMAISDSLRSNWIIYTAGVAAFFYLVRLYISTPGGRYRLDSLKMRLPLFRRLNRKIVSSRFARTMATMLTSGVPLIQSLENVAGALGNTMVEKKILSTREEIRKGIAISVPIRKVGVFPHILVSMIKIGEESGTLDIILDRTADFYDEEVETEVQRMLTFLEPIMIIFMGLIVGFVVISMVLPLFDVYQTI
ncbi:MAG: type II secretion system F family protein [Tindallia sp. MSAO_Bac2]|nr:MAG: type II secretion system F family protein [Tindallia sp. MSAO_Bac2]